MSRVFEPPMIAGGRTLARMRRGNKSDGGGKKRNRKKTWFEPCTEDILKAEAFRLNGISVVIPKKIATKGFRFFK